MANFDEIGVYSLADLDIAKVRADLGKARAEAASNPSICVKNAG